MRTLGPWYGVLALAMLTMTGCQGGNRAGADDAVPAGCGLVDQRTFAVLLGEQVTTSVHGSLKGLRTHGTPVECTMRATGHPDRFVRVRAEHHPAPLQLPKNACNSGWVYAGSPAKYAPACQQAHGRGGTTTLVARWGEYVVRVTVERPDRDWGGDPEKALKMTRQVAVRLGQT
jgi:hypothetical protein